MKKLIYEVSHTGCYADVCNPKTKDTLGEIYLPIDHGQVPNKIEISDAENWYIYKLTKVRKVRSTLNERKAS